ncbi:MAG: transcriptional repressor [Alphaproteobacteria bacterium]|nr:transcriptional repressor [Alphaproteobacteria bacterium]
MKYSRQRELILKTLQENRIHPTAEKVYDLIRQTLPNISLATVYRNLNRLSDAGIIRRIEGVDGIFRFDGEIHEHHHFICKKCGQIYDLSNEGCEDLKEKFAATSGFIIDDCDITLQGTCNKCITKN